MLVVEKITSLFSRKKKTIIKNPSVPKKEGLRFP